MRSTNERVNAVKQRTKELKHIEKIRRSRFIAFSCAAACLAIVVGLAFAMPSIMGRLTITQFSNVGGVASIFSASGTIGYVMLALLAFALGVCVTILCVTVHRKSKEDNHNG